MCGRIACALDPENIRKACTFKDKNSGKFKQPEWKKSSAGLDYHPSLNIAPTDVTPVLLSASHFDHKESEPVLYPMVWGMIPPWHKGDYKSHGLSTNNCRIENLKTSKLYSPALSQGKRCVVLCEGFYEWQTTKKETTVKQPYYIYAPQPEGVSVENPLCWDNGVWCEKNGWTGPKILKMAGLFGSWTSPETKDSPIHSYSVITMESNSTLSWLHHRMPAILYDDQDVMNWIDNGHVPPAQAMDLLKPVTSLKWHPVSTAVNNSRNKTNQCNKPVDLNNPKLSAGSKLMQNWLKRASSAPKESNTGGMKDQREEDRPSEKKVVKRD